MKRYRSYLTGRAKLWWILVSLIEIRKWLILSVSKSLSPGRSIAVGFPLWEIFETPKARELISSNKKLRIGLREGIWDCRTKCFIPMIYNGNYRNSENCGHQRIASSKHPESKEINYGLFVVLVPKPNNRKWQRLNFFLFLLPEVATSYHKIRALKLESIISG